ncbi:hypothetical protein [Geminocystis sp. GBBB08]|uniref:hypothetical protein n=1 Tax=Geminocystis sp. GBBB08 TaxID=2604140 RepID=UPI0027E35C8F|nr:hypothetical protein [Geminocystis sp. GBBB08]MBL1209189.1 hypothetical protein [Geminocystis sp. GBBB08]
MNFKSMLFSGIINAMIVAMIALAVNHISGREHRRKIVVTGGAILGFVIGCGFQCVAQQKNDDFDQGNTLESSQNDRKIDN